MGLPSAPKLASVAQDLPLEALEHLVERRGHVFPRPLRPKDPPRRRAGHLHPMPAVDARVRLLRDLDLEPGHLWVDPGKFAELVLSRAAHLLGDPHAAPLQHEIHAITSPNATEARGFRGEGPSLADLVFGPTLACRGDRRHLVTA